MFKNISIRVFLIAISVILAGASVLFAAVLMSAFGALDQARKEHESLELQVESFKDTRFHVVQIQQFLTDVGATRTQDGFAEAQTHLAMAQDKLAAIAAINAAQQGACDDLKQQIDGLHRTGVKMAWDYINQGVEVGNASMKAETGGFDVVSAKLAEDLDRLADRLNEDLRLSSQRLDNTMSSYSLSLTFIAFSLAGVVSIGLLLVYLKIEPPLQMMKRSLLAIKQGGGDLRARLPNEGNNEIGEIVNLFNDFLGVLQGLMRDITSETEQLVDSSRRLAAMSQRAKDDMRKQQLSTDQVATTVTQLSATVAEVAANTQNAAGMANQSRAAASTGKDTVAATVSSIHALSGGIDQASAVIATVENDCENVSSVLDVIQGIADQTNLLALNAAIEAARAGEQGRGFAVVADEVRTLASRTQGSTQEIHSMIERLQRGSREAVKAMTDSQGQVKQMVGVIESAGNALGNIVGMTGEISAMSAHISNAVNEQKIVVEHINQNIVAINDVTSANSANAEQAAVEAQHVQQIAGNLQNSIGRFRV